MKRKLVGTINYSIVIDGDNIEAEYDRTTENELAAMVITQHVMEGCAIMQRENKKIATKAKEKQAMAKNLDHILKARVGLNTIMSLFMEGYAASKPSMPEDKEAAIRAWIKENNVTLEDFGKMTEQEVEELFKKKNTPPSTVEEIKSDQSEEGDW